MRPNYMPDMNDTDTITNAVFAAYEKLPENERESIRNLAKLLVRKVKDKNSQFKLSEQGAIEIIGKCGIELTKEMK